MASKLHPHTHAVQQAARNLDAVAQRYREGPKFMSKPERRLPNPPEITLKRARND